MYNFINIIFVFRFALTKLDILDSFETIDVAVSYKLDGQVLKSPPGKLICKILTLIEKFFSSCRRLGSRWSWIQNFPWMELKDKWHSLVQSIAWHMQKLHPIHWRLCRSSNQICRRWSISWSSYCPNNQWWEQVQTIRLRRYNLILCRLFSLIR